MASTRAGRRGCVGHERARPPQARISPAARSAKGSPMTSAGPPQGSNSAPVGGSEAREPDGPSRGRTAECEARGSSYRPQAWGDHATSAGFARALAQATTARAVCDQLPRAALIGNPDRPIHAIGALSAHESGVLAFCDAARAPEHLAHTQAAVVIVSNTLAAMPRAEQTFVAVDDVRSAFIDIVEALLPRSRRPADPAPGIDAEAVIGEGAAISPLACTGRRVRASARVPCSTRTSRSAATA
jgi:hypothetical protein